MIIIILHHNVHWPQITEKSLPFVKYIGHTNSQASYLQERPFWIWIEVWNRNADSRRTLCLPIELTNHQWLRLFYVLCYLRTSFWQGIFFLSVNGFHIKAYSDAYSASCSTIRWFVTGYFILLDVAPVSQKSENSHGFLLFCLIRKSDNGICY